jgi:hypothetical protein
VGETKVYDLPEVADPDVGDTWTITAIMNNAKGFASLAMKSENTWCLVLNPKAGDVGTFDIELQITDQRGSFSKSSKYFIKIDVKAPTI